VTRKHIIRTFILHKDRQYKIDYEIHAVNSDDMNSPANK